MQCVLIAEMFYVTVGLKNPFVQELIFLVFIRNFPLSKEPGARVPTPRYAPRVGYEYERGLSVTFLVTLWRVPDGHRTRDA